MNYKKLIDSVKRHEGYSKHVYTDTLGYETIGYGFAIKDLELDEDIAGIILERKMAELLNRIMNKFPWIAKQPAVVQEVVMDICYNIGVTGFSKFVKTIDYIKSSDYIMAGEELLNSKYAKQVLSRAKENSEKLKGC